MNNNNNCKECKYTDTGFSEVCEDCINRCGPLPNRIIALVGASGSGKTTIAELLEKEGYNYIESYTTRPKRDENERGHIFVDNNTFYYHNCPGTNENNMIAYTFFNGFHYWATKEQYQGKGTSIYIIDVAGIKELREKVKDAEIIVIYLQCDRQNRYIRMCADRGEEATVERLNHDKKAFEIVQCDYVVDANRPVKEVLKLIKKLI